VPTFDGDGAQNWAQFLDLGLTLALTLSRWLHYHDSGKESRTVPKVLAQDESLTLGPVGASWGKRGLRAGILAKDLGSLGRRDSFRELVHRLHLEDGTDGGGQAGAGRDHGPRVAGGRAR